MRHTRRTAPAFVVVAVLASSRADLAERPAPMESGPKLSSLAKGCTLKETVGPDWRRLWVDCGCGAFRVTEPESLALHVNIGTPEQALEFLRLFTAPAACDLVPEPAWVEIEASERDGWFALSRDRFARLCEPPNALGPSDIPGDLRQAFRVRRCVVSPRDGALYAAEDFVTSGGLVTEGERKLLLPAARLGSCSNAVNADKLW